MDINKKINNLLNELVQINNDRIEGYERAAKESKDSDLITLFESMASKSRSLNSELGSEISNRGGKSTDSTTSSGKVFRVWMDFKAALTGKDRKAILSSCEFGEDAALATYDKVLADTNLPPNLTILVRQQREKLNEDHNRVKALRDSVLHEHEHN